MSKIKLNVHDTVAVPVEPPKVVVQAPVETKSFEDKNFHNWIIDWDKPDENGVFKGHNKESKETFTGTYHLFRERMRG